MIRLPVQTFDRSRAGVLHYNRGSLSVELGTLLPTDELKIRAELQRSHDLRADDVGPPAEDDDEPMRTPIEGIGTADRFLFAAHRLHFAGFLAMFESMEGDDELQEVT